MALDNSLPAYLCKDPYGMALCVEEEFSRTVNWVRDTELRDDDHCIQVDSLPASIFEQGMHGQDIASRIESFNDVVRHQMRVCLSQSPLGVRQWVVTLRSIILFVTQSRAIMFLNELGTFFLIIALIFCLNSRESVEVFIIFSILILMPMAIVSALDSYIVLGKILNITDDDLRYTSDLLLLRDRKPEYQEGIASNRVLDSIGAVVTNPINTTDNDIMKMETIYDCDKKASKIHSMQSNPMLTQKSESQIIAIHGQP
jgi:hypothetical protein